MGQRPSAEQLFNGGGEMGALIRAHNWAETGFGPMEHWPQSLRSALGICLGARFPIAIYWGPDRLLLYNDAWRPIVGDKHPWALGRPAQAVWPEIWDDIGPEFDQVFATGEGIFHSDELLAMHRFGYTEECFFDYTFNPIQGVSGRVEGIFNVGSETTYRVLGDRRAALLRQLASCTGLAKTVDEAGALIAAALDTDRADIPLALLYTLDDDGTTAHLSGGAAAGQPFAPAQVSLEAEAAGGWPIASVAQTAQAQTLDNLEQRFGALPGSPWPEPPQEAMVLPVAVAGQAGGAAVLVLVASPRRRLDAAYRDFFEQVAAQVAAAIANAQAQEEDRRQTEQLAEQKHLLELIASGQPLEEALAAICASLSQLNPHIRAGFLLVDEARQRFMRAVAPDFSEDFRAALAGMPIGTIPIGTCAEAVACGEPVTCVDVVNDSCWSPAWRDLCLAHGIRACHSTPVLDAAGQPLASLMLCFDRPQTPTPWEYQLTNFGTQIARIAFERDRTTLALRASEHRYRTLFESMNQGFCLCELLLDDGGTPVDYRFLEVNPAFEGLTGLRQVTGKTARDLIPNLDPFWLETYGRVVMERQSCQFERESVLSGRWFSIYTFPIGPAQGQRFAILLTDISDRRRLEQERERFLAVGSDLLVITGNDGYFQWVSPTFERVLGWADADLMARPWIEFVHPDDRAATRREAEAVFERGGTTFSFENRYRHRDGTYRWFLWNAQLYPEAGVLYGAAVDITSLKQAEETLRQRETELRLVTDAVPALISFVDADQRYRFNNRGYEEWFGRRAADLYGQHLREVLGEAAYDNIRPHVEQVLAGEKVTFDTQLAYRDGGSRYVSATYVPRFSDRGVVEGFVALINDISDRRQAEAALIHSEERYRYLAESIPQLVWTANAEGLLTDTNQRWCSFTGLTLEQVKVAGWQAVVHPDDLATLSHNWAQAQQQGGNYQAEGRMRRADGVYRWHLHQAVPVKDIRGRVTRWFGTATDIEDQKQLEQQRSQLLRQEQAARAAAEAASRTKDEFLAVVSHELRSPLNPILGWATLLKNGGLSEAKTQQALAVIERNAKLQTELIDDLLDVSRMLRGKLQISASPVNLATVIRAAIETVRLSAEAKGIQLETRLEPGVGLVSGDATRLQQVVWNLLSNAVKFTPAAGRIAVSLSQAGAGQARIVVTDTGKGITPEFLPMIFDYFRQADSATTRQFGGLGLGLAIVRHLVELHGGTIQAASPGEGGGATFTVSLPTLAEQPAAAQAAPLGQAALELPGAQVLVVDDDGDTRTFITFLLEQAGGQVVSVTSAQECLDALGQVRPQVIVSDIGMPDMDGYMMMRRIRALPADQGGSIPAIALTAYVREADQEQSLAAGFQRHIAKPVEPAALLRAIAELLAPQSS